MRTITKGDKYFIQTIKDILNEGSYDQNPRPHYVDGTPAHTFSINHVMHTYDLSKGEFPIITLRPVYVKKAIGEILWIYQDQSNDLDILKDKYNCSVWDEWDIGNRTIGSCYGEVVRQYDLIDKLLTELKEDPDGRRHIINLWQEDSFKKPHGLKPCAFQTIWNVRHEQDADYLDMTLIQRSSDFCTAGAWNQVQYTALLYMVARHCGFKVGRFTWFCANVQIYDRHIKQAEEMLLRKPIDCKPYIELNPDIKNFYQIKIDDIKVAGYPIDKIKEINPQLKFEIGI